MELRSCGDGVDHEVITLGQGTTEDKTNTKQEVLLFNDNGSPSQIACMAG